MARGGIIYGPHTYGTIRTLGRTSNTIMVGKYCSIGHEVCALMEDDHEMDNISTYPFGHPNMWVTQRYHLVDKQALYRRNRSLDIQVGNDVWIGYGAVLFRGVKVGDGAVIGAFTKVVKNIPAYSVVVGNSRIVRKRFSDEDIAFLLKLKWWDLDDETVASIVPILHSGNINGLRRWANEHGIHG